MMFNIFVKGSLFDRDGESFLLGAIEGPDLQEDFWAPMGYWGRERYESQWCDGIRTLLAGRPAALVVSMRDPGIANFIDLWLMYPMGETIVLQNKMLVLSSPSVAFDERGIDASVPVYREYDEDGDRISQWEMPRKHFSAFLDSKSMREQR